MLSGNEQMLNGRTALVTGGSGGIGRAIVELFLNHGAIVHSLDRPTLSAVSGATALGCDLSDSAQCTEIITDFVKRVPECDLIVHAAGITRDGYLSSLSDDDWSRVMRVNLDSAFVILRAISPVLRERKSGSVLLIASINGERGKSGQANYAASKAGLISLARTAARELGPSGVRVNAIAPGLIETSMTADLPKAVRERAIAESALRKSGLPEDVAHAALFLCSNWSRHVTGQVLRVDGGQLIG